MLRAAASEACSLRARAPQQEKLIRGSCTTARQEPVGSNEDLEPPDIKETNPIKSVFFFLKDIMIFPYDTFLPQVSPS